MSIELKNIIINLKDQKNKDLYYKKGYKLKIMDVNDKELDGVEITEKDNYIDVLINNEDGIEVKINLIAL